MDLTSALINLSQSASAELQALIDDEGKGVAPDLIYARGIPDFPNPPPTNVCRSECAIIEIGFCRDLGCVEKRDGKHTKYEPLIKALRAVTGARWNWSASPLAMLEQPFNPLYMTLGAARRRRRLRRPEVSYVRTYAPDRTDRFSQSIED